MSCFPETRKTVKRFLLRDLCLAVAVSSESRLLGIVTHVILTSYGNHYPNGFGKFPTLSFI